MLALDLEVLIELERHAAAYLTKLDVLYEQVRFHRRPQLPTPDIFKIDPSLVGCHFDSHGDFCPERI